MRKKLVLPLIIVICCLNFIDYFPELSIVYIQAMPYGTVSSATRGFLKRGAKRMASRAKKTFDPAAL